MSVSTKTEKRKLQIHPKLLFDVIRRQAGSLAKALLEAVMNSADARATYCRITAEEGSRTLIIEDDGKGIIKREEIEKWFETFGQPHEASENKIYGSFRMGRGQLFAYGVNTWRTGTWQMRVDFKNDGDNYELTKMAKAVKGCRIELQLYDPLTLAALQDTADCITTWTKYAPVAVFWNGEKQNVDPRTEEWDHKTPEAYIRLNSRSELSVYNLGIHTMDLGCYRYGSGGVIVSRQQLKVNFARNDVQSDCPVWQKILPLVKKKTQEKLRKKVQLTDGERQALAKQVLGGEIDEHEIMNQKLVTAVNGRHFTIREIMGAYGYQSRISLCPQGDPVGDKLFQRKSAFVISQETLTRFGVKSLKDLEAKLQKRCPHFKLCKIVPFETLSKGMDRNYLELDPDQVRPNEKLWQDLSGPLYSRLCRSRYQDYIEQRQQLRRILIGKGPANGWTDGISYVCLARSFLDGLSFNLPGLVDLCTLLIHEACHDAPDTAEHIHTQEFYELYHDLTRRSLPELVDYGLGEMSRVLKAAKGRLPRATLWDLDRRLQIGQEQSALREKAQTKVKIKVQLKKQGAA